MVRAFCGGSPTTTSTGFDASRLADGSEETNAISAGQLARLPPSISVSVP
jgi:hypothetical protein